MANCSGCSPVVVRRRGTATRRRTPARQARRAAGRASRPASGSLEARRPVSSGSLTGTRIPSSALRRRPRSRHMRASYASTAATAAVDPVVPRLVPCRASSRRGPRAAARTGRAAVSRSSATCGIFPPTWSVRNRSTAAMNRVPVRPVPLHGILAVVARPRRRSPTARAAGRSSRARPGSRPSRAPSAASTSPPGTSHSSAPPGASQTSSSCSSAVCDAAGDERGRVVVAGAVEAERRSGRRTRAARRPRARTTPRRSSSAGSADSQIPQARRAHCQLIIDGRVVPLREQLRRLPATPGSRA